MFIGRISLPLFSWLTRHPDPVPCIDVLEF